MRNIPFDEDAPHLTKQAQLQRIQRVIREELSPCQRETLLLHYFQQLTVSEIAARRGIHKSTVLRTLRRAENRLRRYLKY